METQSKETEQKLPKKAARTTWSKVGLLVLYFFLYASGILTLFVIISENFAMNTYFSDNSLLPGYATREFSLETEAMYYLKSLKRLSRTSSNKDALSFASLPPLTNYIKNELNNFGVEVYDQNFSYTRGIKQYNGTNIYSIIRGERSTSSESIALCVPLKGGADSSTMPGIGLTLAIVKYFSSRTYWAKDVIVLFVDGEEIGLSAWLDSYHDVRFGKSDYKSGIYYDNLVERSGPMQAAVVLEAYGEQFIRMNVKIHGMYGQLPNLDFFNLIIEMAARETVTPYFHNKSHLYGLSSTEVYNEHLDTVMSFIKSQATMQSDGLHGMFLRNAIQSLTLEIPAFNERRDNKVLVSTSLQLGRLIEGVFRSLNNLTERFNRSYYFYIIISLRRFTSIGYYMIAVGLMLAPVLLKVHFLHREQSKTSKLMSLRVAVILSATLILGLLSILNISTAIVSSIATVPILLLI